MIKGLGIDLVKIERVSNLIDRWDNRFLKKVFTGEELAYSRTRSLTPQHLAARFAAKEAALKMLGKGLKGLNWHQLEIINDSNGKPELVLHGRASELANMIGIKEIHLSITHEREYAIAQVIGEG
jgi:holo-[acyl-carrier protein] synthase